MDPGFAAKDVLLLTVNPQLIGYDETQNKDFVRRVVEGVSALPGVEATSAARLAPLGDSSNSSGPILKEGETLPRGSAGRNIMNTAITPGYFRRSRSQSLKAATLTTEIEEVPCARRSSISVWRRCSGPVRVRSVSASLLE